MLRLDKVGIMQNCRPTVSVPARPARYATAARTALRDPASPATHQSAPSGSLRSVGGKTGFGKRWKFGRMPPTKARSPIRVGVTLGVIDRTLIDSIKYSRWFARCIQ